MCSNRSEYNCCAVLCCAQKLLFTQVKNSLETGIWDVPTGRLGLQFAAMVMQFQFGNWVDHKEDPNVPQAILKCYPRSCARVPASPLPAPPTAFRPNRACLAAGDEMRCLVSCANMRSTTVYCSDALFVRTVLNKTLSATRGIFKSGRRTTGSICSAKNRTSTQFSS